MPVPNRSHSYPFLSISRHHNIPYGIVLTAADAMAHKRSNGPICEVLSHLSAQSALDIGDEVRWQARISAGEIPFDAIPGVYTGRGMSDG